MFLPREKKFFGLYQALSDKIIEAIELLEKLKQNYSQLCQIAEKLKALEDEADDIVHEIAEQLLYDHTRVTEEKGDIRFFAHNMDNIIDSIEKAVNRLCLYHVKIIPQAVVEFIPLLKEAAQEIKKGVGCLENLKKGGKILAECCVKINELENKTDQINRKWLQKVLTEPIQGANDIRQTVALKEIIDTLEYAMDQCEDVANVLETFRLKGQA